MRKAFLGSDRARTRRLCLAGASALIVLGADQVTKSLAVADLANGPVHLLGPLSLQLEYNSGIAFSLGSGMTVLIVAIVVVLVALLAWSIFRAEARLAAIGNGMALGGALGNLADRLFRGNGGAVIDFIHTTFWPTFNVADASIVVGCVLIAIGLWRATSHPDTSSNVHRHFASSAAVDSDHEDGEHEDTVRAPSDVELVAAAFAGTP